ncbi:SPFH domain-containing protein [Rubrobacter taiwanensis]|jgi:regulator of protease activity HflC (stomatin/prohibitin superfamily)|uniref:SPFH domain-containing protein n=1 Tax=Rubrobacter taiwanensis TaxID=185139 RepID=A0A4R1BCU1_9ACTN|nr:SPFH domain-containing protein [Rubrobacter taiwanensis]TCJ14817.1 SPFH domain-containing protein [Rubrobacter taiwanensis]
MTVAPQARQFSKIKEVVSGWSGIRQYLRGGDEGQLVPVVIPKDRRRYGWIFLLGVAFYVLFFGVFSGSAELLTLSFPVVLIIVALAGLWLWRGSIVEIEQGTTGILSRYGKITGTLSPGRHYLWRPWEKVEAVVDTTTEIPYLAPVMASPTRENVPLKSIEFFLKFKIDDPIAFVRTLGASNFDLVLSSAVQDAIRQRSRRVRTEQAYDLRGSDVEDMRENLNRQLERYGVRILGANIPDVQLPDQYQQHLATRERVSKELVAYEREWELIRKRRIDALLMEIEKAKKERDARLVEVNAARNKARQDVARMLEERETEAQRVRMEIETRGRSTLIEAENEAKALRHLGQTYRDNRAVLQYELARRRVEVGEKLMQRAPRPLLVQGGAGEQSALSTLVLARLLPQLAAADEHEAGPAAREAAREVRGLLERGQDLPGLKEEG